MKTKMRPLDERMNDLIQWIRKRVTDKMHRDDGSYDHTVEDIRKRIIEFDRGD